MATLNATIKKKIDIKKLIVNAQVRYWEDTTVNGKEDTDGSLVPCRKGDAWKPEIDIDSGIILNWKKGTEASIHYKVCDAGTYTLIDDTGLPVVVLDGYVPDILCPTEAGYGDYIIMEINSDGEIKDWCANLECFEKKMEDEAGK